MNDFRLLEVGDKVTRKMTGFENIGERVWSFDGEVIEVRDNVIVCTVMVDQPRTMLFSRNTGVSTSGISAGWLEIG